MLGDKLQNLITYSMTKGIVNLFKMINITHNYRKRLSLSLPLIQRSLHAASINQAC